MNIPKLGLLALLVSVTGTAFALTPTPTPTPSIPPISPPQIRLDCEFAMIAYKQDRLIGPIYAKECVVALTFRHSTQTGAPRIEVPLSCALKATPARDKMTCSTPFSQFTALRIPPGYEFVSARSYYFPDRDGREEFPGCIPATLPGPGLPGAVISPMVSLSAANNFFTAKVTHRLLCDM